MESTATFILKQSATSATPLLLAGFGELIAQRAGVINVGIEGIMLMGTISAFAAAILAGSATAAIPAAILAGLLMGALFSLVVVWMRADQIVAGTALNILAVGLSTTAWRFLQPYISQGHPIPHLFETFAVPGLTQIPLLGPSLFNQFVLFYAVIILGAILYLTFQFTRVGLVIQALGDAPDACDAAGISVRFWRTALLLFAGAAAGLAGAYLSTMEGHTFQINMTGGKGFLVLALVIFARWTLPGFFLVVFSFAAIDSLQRWLVSTPQAAAHIPHQLFDMLPYAATLIALAILTRSKTGPIHLGRPWPE